MAESKIDDVVDDMVYAPASYSAWLAGRLSQGVPLMWVEVSSGFRWAGARGFVSASTHAQSTRRPLERARLCVFITLYHGSRQFRIIVADV